MAVLNNSNAISPSGYDVNNSLRFRASASAYLSRTPASAGNRQKYTRSVWIKRGALSTAIDLFAAGSGNTETVRLNASDTLMVRVGNVDSTSNRVFRDASAWGHLVVSVDTTQATSTERMKTWWNNEQITWSTYNVPAQNTQTEWNNNAIHTIGASAVILNFLDGYLTEFYNIDGQALTPSSFGATDTTTGVWKPKAYSGTYGTNGFYLKFSDIATTSGSNAGLGKDFSGNTNYWTTNNISVTSGTTYDAMKDSPTNTSATVANYAVMNPLKNGGTAPSGGNLNIVSSIDNRMCLASIGMSSGKYYWEFVQTAGGNSVVGIAQDNAGLSTYVGGNANSWGYHQSGLVYTNTSGTSYGNTWTTNDIIGVAFDADNGKLYFSKNGTWQNSGDPVTGTNPAYSSLTASPYFPASQSNISASSATNFGQRPFSYTPPTGYVALNTYNLPTPTVLQGNKYMDATLYTGTGSSLSVTNAGSFQPDLVWIKSRSNAQDHKLTDVVRGTTKSLESNTTDAEATDTNGLTAFGSSGFTVGTDATYNTNTYTYVGWQWKAGNSAGSSNTSGTITSTVSVNTTAGFSIVNYVGNNTSGATVGHGLGVAPSMIIVKNRDQATAGGDSQSWFVYHRSIGATGQLTLNTTGAVVTNAEYWNNTSPSATVFSLGNGNRTNFTGDDYIAYCWASISGFSAFGSYTGNGSADGPFVYTGFRPKFVMIKRTDTTANWIIYDSVRNTYNVVNLRLIPNTSDAEASVNTFDFLASGFKLRTSDVDRNASGGTYIYAAFAENPFKNANAR